MLCSVRLLQSSPKKRDSVPQSTRQHSACHPLRRKAATNASSPSSSHALFLRSVGLMQPQYSFIPLQSFVRLTLHCIPLIALSFIVLHSSHICVCRPPFFRRLLLRSAIGVGSASSACVFHSSEQYSKNKTDSNTILFSLAVVARFALNQGTPKADLYFSPSFHAHIRFVSLLPSLNSRVYGGCSITATPPLRSSSAKKSSLPQKRGTTFFAPCGAWGC